MMPKVLLAVICAAIPIFIFVVVHLTERDFKRMEREVEDFYESEYTSTMTTAYNPCNIFFTNYGDGPVDIKPHQLGDIANDQYGNSWAADSNLKWHQIAYYPSGNGELTEIKYGLGNQKTVLMYHGKEVDPGDANMLDESSFGLWKWESCVDSLKINDTHGPSCKCAYCGCTNDHIYGTCDYCGAPLEGGGGL